MSKISKGSGSGNNSNPAALGIMSAHPLKLRKQQLILLKQYFKKYEEEQNALAANMFNNDSDDSDAENKIAAALSPQKMSIKKFAKILAKILEKNHEEVEEELRLLSLGKIITFEEFETFHKDFIEQLYTNPSHPLDMQLSQLNEIRKEFEEANARAKDKNSSNEGIPIDGFSQILARKMNMDPSRISKFLKKTAFFNSITWIEFQSMLDKESTIREELLDWYMHKVDKEESNEHKTVQSGVDEVGGAAAASSSSSAAQGQSESALSLQYRCEMSLKPLQRTSQRNFVIEYMLEARIGKKLYYFVVFDESTIALYHADTFESALEFLIPQDPLSQNSNSQGAKRSKSAAQKTNEPVVPSSPMKKPSEKKPIGTSVGKQRGQQTGGNTGSKYQGNINNSNSPNTSLGGSDFQFFSPMQKQNPEASSNLSIAQDYLSKQASFKLPSPAIQSQNNQSDSQPAAKFRLRGRSSFVGTGKKANQTSYQNSGFSMYQHETNRFNKEHFASPEMKPASRFRSQSQYIDSNAQQSNTSMESPSSVMIMMRSPAPVQRKSEFYSEKSHRIQLMSASSNLQTAAPTSAAKSMTIDYNFNKANQGTGGGVGVGLAPIGVSLEEDPLMNINIMNSSSVFAQMRGLRQPKKSENFHLPSPALNKNASIFEQSPIATSDWLNSSPSKRKEDRGSVMIRSIYEENMVRMEDDPELSKIIKTYLTTEIKDEEDKKKILVTFDQFYGMYKRDPYKYSLSPITVNFPHSAFNQTISSRTMTKEQEDYLVKDEETKETLRRLWKKFQQLPKEYTIGYAKAVNEIVHEKNLKSVNFENLKQFFKKPYNQTIGTSGVNTTTSTKAASVTTTPQKSQTPILRKHLPSSWRSDTGKTYLKYEHINLNPWSLEWRKQPEHLMPTKMKEYQNSLTKNIEERALEKLRNNGKKRVNLQDEYPETLPSGADLWEGKNEEEPITKNRTNRMKSFSIQYLNELNLLAVGMINRQVQLYCASDDSMQVFIRKVYAHQFNDVVIAISFRLNVVTQKWNIALLFENDTLRIYEFTLSSESRPRITAFDQFFTYEFPVEIDKMAMFSEFGFVLTSYKGGFFIFQDHLTSSNSSDEVKSIPQYYLDQEKKLTENGVALSITAIACSETSKILIFGTSRGKIAFYEVKTKEFLGVREVGGEEPILNLHVYKKQNQLIAISRNQMVSIWDIARRMLIHSFRAFDESTETGVSKISASIFTLASDSLMIVANSLKIWDMKPNKELLFKERKMRQLFEWRRKDINKQDNYLELEVEKFRFKKPADRKISELPQQLGGQLSPVSAVHGHEMNDNQVTMKQVITMSDVIVCWDSNSEIRIISPKDFKTKYTFMLSAPEDDSIEYLDILNNKILAMCTEKGDIYLKNLYTEDLCQKITDYEGYPLKLNLLVFLPDDCQMSIAASSQEGKVIFFNSYLKRKSSKKYIFLHAHRKRVISMVSNGLTTMVSAGEENFINIYTLRSCSIIYKVDFSLLGAKQMVQGLCFSQNRAADRDRNAVLVVLEEGQIYEVNCNDGNVLTLLKQRAGRFSNIGAARSGTQLLTVDEDLQLSMLNRSNDREPVLKNFVSSIMQMNQQASRLEALTAISAAAVTTKNIKNAIPENEKWTPSESLKLDFKKERILAKLPEDEVHCIKIHYDQIKKVYYVFLSHRTAFLIDPVNETKRNLIYATGEVTPAEPLHKPKVVTIAPNARKISQAIEINTSI